MYHPLPKDWSPYCVQVNSPSPVWSLFCAWQSLQPTIYPVPGLVGDFHHFLLRFRAQWLGICVYWRRRLSVACSQNMETRKLPAFPGFTVHLERFLPVIQSHQSRVRLT